jgi:hypothetical protein
MKLVGLTCGMSMLHPLDGLFPHQYEVTVIVLLVLKNVLLDMTVAILACFWVTITWNFHTFNIFFLSLLVRHVSCRQR